MPYDGMCGAYKCAAGEVWGGWDGAWAGVSGYKRCLKGDDPCAQMTIALKFCAHGTCVAGGGFTNVKNCLQEQEPMTLFEGAQRLFFTSVYIGGGGPLGGE